MRNTSLFHQQKYRGFTLVELLVVIAIIGILIAMLLPAVQAARESARRLSCVNNMNQLGMALVEWESANNHYPSGVLDEKGPILNQPEGRQVGWIVQLLPYLEEGVVYNNIDQEMGIYAKENQVARALPIPIFSCPSCADNVVIEDDRDSYAGMGMDPMMGGAPMGGGPMGGDPMMGGGGPGGDTMGGPVESTVPAGGEASKEKQDEKEEKKPLTRGNRAVSCYAACCGDVETPIDVDMTGVFFLNSKITRDDITDGLTHTLLLSEKPIPDTDLGWMSGSCATLRNTAEPPRMLGYSYRSQIDDESSLDTSKVGSFNSPHPTICNVLFADGTVRGIPHEIKPEIFKLYGNRADGKLITEGPTRDRD